MVNALYRVDSRRLRVVDEDPDKGEMQCRAHSGTDDCDDMDEVGLGPLPTGQYRIYNRGSYHGHPAFVLDPVDDATLNDRWDDRPDGIRRSAFRIHVAFPDLEHYGSNGCVVLKAERLDQLKSFLDATDKGPVATVVSPNPGGVPADHFTSPLFGVLTVKC